MTWLEILAQCAWRGTVILTAAFAAAAFFRQAPGRVPRGTAALRHFIWTAAFAALLLLPLALAAVPRWIWAPPAATEARHTVALVPPADGQVQTLGQVLVVAGNRAAQFPVPILILWIVGC